MIISRHGNPGGILQTALAKVGDCDTYAASCSKWMDRKMWGAWKILRAFKTCISGANELLFPFLPTSSHWLPTSSHWLPTSSHWLPTSSHWLPTSIPAHLCNLRTCCICGNRYGPVSVSTSLPPIRHVAYPRTCATCAFAAHVGTVENIFWKQ